jgi:hypothetical protein
VNKQLSACASAFLNCRILFAIASMSFAVGMYKLLLYYCCQDLHFRVKMRSLFFIEIVLFVSSSPILVHSFKQIKILSANNFFTYFLCG